MVSTRKSKRVATDSDEDEKVPQIREEEPQDSGSDSDDAPEEVTFVKSKKVSSAAISGHDTKRL